MGDEFSVIILDVSCCLPVFFSNGGYDNVLVPLLVGSESFEKAVRIDQRGLLANSVRSLLRASREMRKRLASPRTGHFTQMNSSLGRKVSCERIMADSRVGRNFVLRCVYDDVMADSCVKMGWVPVYVYDEVMADSRVSFASPTVKRSVFPLRRYSTHGIGAGEKCTTLFHGCCARITFSSRTLSAPALPSWKRGEQWPSTCGTATVSFLGVMRQMEGFLAQNRCTPGLEVCENARTRCFLGCDTGDVWGRDEIPAPCGERTQSQLGATPVFCLFALGRDAGTGT